MPPLLRLFWTESRSSRNRLILFSAISGLSNALVIILINSASSAEEKDELIRVLLQSIVGITVYALSQKILLVSAVARIEQLLEKIRVRVADKIRRCDLATLDRIGRGRLYAAVNQDTITISQTSLQVAMGFQAMVLLVFCSVYLLIVSPLALLISAACVTAAGWIYLKNRAPLEAQMKEAAGRESFFFETMTHMLDGFKQVKLHEPRSAELFAHLQEISGSVTEVKIKTQEKFSSLLIFTEIASYALILANFLLPLLGSGESDSGVKTTGTVTLMLGPIGMMFGAVQSYLLATASAQRIAEVEAELEATSAPAAALAPAGAPAEPAAPAGADLGGFSEIALRDVTFRYPPTSTEGAFGVGPINLSIHRGETLFLVGGNGSGKSTLLLLLTALYRPETGSIEVDGVPIAGREAAYRSLFSTVFVDYHLFKRLYGLADAPVEQVDALLKQMQLDRKTRLVGRDFETYDLSTGQKKRLALIVSLLEDRPIYVFDEWAADQDVIYRQYFYRQLLQELRGRGKTVIAVTHDDRWFEVADRVLEMRDGRLQPERDRGWLEWLQ